MRSLPRQTLAAAAAVAPAVAAAIAVAACSRAPAPPAARDTAAAVASRTDSGPLTPAAQALLDSANTAYRAGRYESALAHYRAATRAAPGSAAPYFGVSMTATKLGNAALADSARAEIARRIDTTAAPAARPH